MAVNTDPSLSRPKVSKAGAASRLGKQPRISQELPTQPTAPSSGFDGQVPASALVDRQSAGEVHAKTVFATQVGTTKEALTRLEGFADWLAQTLAKREDRPAQNRHAFIVENRTMKEQMDSAERDWASVKNGLNLLKLPSLDDANRRALTGMGERMDKVAARLAEMQDRVSHYLDTDAPPPSRARSLTPEEKAFAEGLARKAARSGGHVFLSQFHSKLPVDEALAALDKGAPISIGFIKSQAGKSGLDGHPVPVENHAQLFDWATAEAQRSGTAKSADPLGL